MKIFDKDNSIRVQNFLLALSKEGHQILIIYNPRCREETFRVFIYTRLDCPMDRAVYNYTVEGIDITDLTQTNFLNFSSGMIASLKLQIEKMQAYRYKFSADYSYELVLV